MKELIIELQEKIMKSEYPMLTTRPLYIELENMVQYINEHPDECRNIIENEELKEFCGTCKFADLTLLQYPCNRCNSKQSEWVQNG